MGAVKSHEDFERWIPGIAPVYQAPVAGRWENGVMVAGAWGAKARDLIKQFMLDHTRSPAKG